MLSNLLTCTVFKKITLKAMQISFCRASAPLSFVWRRNPGNITASTLDWTDFRLVLHTCITHSEVKTRCLVFFFCTGQRYYKFAVKWQLENTVWNLIFQRAQKAFCEIWRQNKPLRHKKITWTTTLRRLGHVWHKRVRYFKANKIVFAISAVHLCV